jgi:hypothetical protein
MAEIFFAILGVPLPLEISGSAIGHDLCLGAATIYVPSTPAFHNHDNSFKKVSPSRRVKIDPMKWKN